MGATCLLDISQLYERSEHPAFNVTMRPTNVSFIKCLLALAGIGVVAGDFSYPTVDQVQFRVGETHTIRFETDWEEYSIALYQQEKHENAVWQGATLIGESAAPYACNADSSRNAGRRRS